MYADRALKYLDFLLATFCTSKNVINFMDRKMTDTYSNVNAALFAHHVIAKNTLLITTAIQKSNLYQIFNHILFVLSMINLVDADHRQS